MMATTLLPPEHNIELKCRICAMDFKIAAEGIPIFKTEQLLDKIKNYLHINVNELDKLSHLVCNECVRKIENFHCYALMAQKNQELFNIMYSEKIYREHCTALSSLNTTLYREPPSPVPVQVVTKTQSKSQKAQTKAMASPTGQTKPLLSPTQMASNQQHLQQQQQQQQLQHQQHLNQQNYQHQHLQQPPHQPNQQPVALLTTEDITIFAYQDLKLGQIIKDLELLKLILRALKWNDVGLTIDAQLERLRNTSFRAVLSSPDLLRDEDLVQLLGPYLDHGSFAPPEQNKCGMDYSAKFLDQNNVTEMEVGVDPELFFPYDDEETKSVDQEEMQKIMRTKKEAKKATQQRNRTAATAAKKLAAGCVASTSRNATESNAVPATTTIVPMAPKINAKAPNKTKPPPKVTSAVIVSPDTKRISVKPTSELTIIPEIIEDSQDNQLSTIAAVAAAAEPMPIIPITSASITIEPNPPTETIQVTIDAPTITTTPSESTVTTPVVTATATTATATVTKTTARSAVTTKETTRPRSMRKTNLEQTIGPKTRARSIFNAKHKCNVCGKKLSTSGNLKAHMKTHKPKGKYNCDKCGRIFKTQPNLQRHKEVHHAGERFSCRTCGRVYPSNSTLKQHEIAHSNFRPHKCTICMKTFKRNQDLKFHTNQHTGEKPYQCPQCPKAFASSGNCFSHRRRVHSDKISKKLSNGDGSFAKRTIKV